MAQPVQNKNLLVRVDDFGAHRDGPGDSTPAVAKAVEAARKLGPGAQVVFGPGVYRLGPVRGGRACVELRDLDGVTIRGEKGKTHLIITNPWAGAFRLTRCRNVWVSGVTLDWDPLPFTQGVVTTSDPAAETFEFEVDAGFPTPDDPQFARAKKTWGMCISADRQQPKECGFDALFIASWARVRGRVFRLKAARNGYRVKWIAPGDRWYMLARSGGSGILFNDCTDCGVEDVTIYASPVCAMAASHSSNITARRVQVLIKPGTNRILSTNADGFHCSANRGGPTIEDCLFEGMADDAINIYARPNVVLAVHSPTELTVSPANRIQPGDLLQVFDPRAGVVRGEVKAAEVRPDGRNLRLTLAEPVPGVKAGTNSTNADTVCNLNACGQGYRIRNNTMRLFRGRGIMVRAGSGLIEGNTIDRVSSMGIMVTNEPSWPEGPAGRDVIIRGNKIIGGGYSGGWGGSEQGASIQILTKRLGWKPAAGRGVSKIRIENNTIVDPCRYGILVGSASDVRIVNNTVTATADSPVWAPSAGIGLFNCDGVRIEGFTMVDPRASVVAAVLVDKSVDPGQAGVTIANVKAELAAGKPDVKDDR